MLKKLLLICTFVFSTAFALGANNVEKYKKEIAVDIEKSISNMNKQNHSIAVVIADVFAADEFLKNLPNLKKDKINEMLFLLPDVTLYRQNIKAVSKNVDKVYVIFSEKPLTEKYLGNRSYEEYENQGLIEGLDNVYTYTLPIDSNLEKYIVEESMEKPALDTKLYKLLKQCGIYIIQE